MWIRISSFVGNLFYKRILVVVVGLKPISLLFATCIIMCLNDCSIRPSYTVIKTGLNNVIIRDTILILFRIRKFLLEYLIS